MHTLEQSSRPSSSSPVNTEPEYVASAKRKYRTFINEHKSLYTKISDTLVSHVATERGIIADCPQLKSAVAKLIQDITENYAINHLDPANLSVIGDKPFQREQFALLDQLLGDDPVEALDNYTGHHIMAGVRECLEDLPESVFIKSDDSFISTTKPLYHFLPDVGDTIGRVQGRTFTNAPLIGTPLSNLFYRNTKIMSGIPKEQVPHLSSDTLTNFSKPNVFPKDYKAKDPNDIVYGYLEGTPFLAFFDTPLPLAIPERTRFSHTHMVAGTGHGKTQTMQKLILNDLERLPERPASIVVIDSQGDLINHIKRLKLFAAGEPLADKLVLIDPTDVEYPLALNLFDANLDRLRQYSPLDRERMVNGLVELYDFVFGSLLGAELTQKQGVLFRYIMRLLLEIPEANIQTFRKLMEPNGLDAYTSSVERLTGTARAFFDTEYNSREFEQTKRQVLRRLWGVLENQTFERMFSHPKNKLDLFSEMNAGKVILINTAKDLLKETGSEIFGRFFIAMLTQSALERSTIQQSDRMPTFVYIDEAADYFDENIATILEQARKYNVAMFMAHQHLGQLTPQLQQSFSANTAIKIAGGTSDRDARQMAHDMRCDPSFIQNMRAEKDHTNFAVYARNVTDAALRFSVPFGAMESMERQSPDEERAVRDRMRERYAVHHTEVADSIQGTYRPPEPDQDEDPTKPQAW